MARRRWLWGAEAAVERRGSAQGWSRGLIKGGARIWVCVPAVSTARIAAVIRAGKPDHATALRYPGLGQGNFWKATGAGRLASGSMRKRGVERGHGAARERRGRQCGAEGSGGDCGRRKKDLASGSAASVREQANACCGEWKSGWQDWPAWQSGGGARRAGGCRAALLLGRAGATG